MTQSSIAFALFACALPLACAEAPPPPAVDGEIVARAVQLAQARAERARTGARTDAPADVFANR